MFLLRDYYHLPLTNNSKIHTCLLGCFASIKVIQVKSIEISQAYSRQVGKTIQSNPKKFAPIHRFQTLLILHTFSIDLFAVVFFQRVCLNKTFLPKLIYKLNLYVKFSSNQNPKRILDDLDKFI